MSDFIVKIEYKNEEGEPMFEKEYDFIQYTELLHRGLMHILSDVEDSFYYFSGNKQKANWSKDAMERFQGIRHKILDEANSLRRLPANLSYRGIPANSIPASEWLNAIIK